MNDSITERTGVITETYGCKLHDETQYLECAICDVERLESEAIAMRLRIENDALRLKHLRELLEDARLHVRFHADVAEFYDCNEDRELLENINKELGYE